MDVLIIEDENPAAEKLERYLHRLDKSIVVLKIIDTVKESKEWLSEFKNTIDLIFMDIQLKDGISFEIFQKVSIDIPIIFTTAYDQYAIDAFKVNGIEYLLKPITLNDLKSALEKYHTLKSNFKPKDLTNFTSKLTRKKVKDRFLVKLGNYIHSVKSEDIAYFNAEGRTVYLISKESKKFIVDYKLQDLENILDSEIFFRVNRSYIISISNIDNISVYSNSRLKIQSKTHSEQDIIVSREKVNGFKEWLDR